MSKTYGYNVAVRIGGSIGANDGTPYKIASATVQFRSDTHDVTDTEGNFGPGGDGEPRRERGVGLGEAEITMTAFLDPDLGIHVQPYNFRIQNRIPLIKIFPAGLTSSPDQLSDVLIDDVRKDPIGDPQQPNRVTIHGFCGNFLEAGTV